MTFPMSFMEEAPTACIVSATMVRQYKQQAKRQCPACHREGHEPEALYCKYCGAQLDEEVAEGESNDRPNDEKF